MTIRPYDPAKDYGMVAAWWQSHGLALVPPQSSLPPGLVAEHDDRGPVAVVFAYTAREGSIAWLAFIVGNPAANPLHVYDGIAACVVEWTVRLRDIGIQLIFGSYAGGLVDLVESCGFKPVERGKTELVYVG